MTQLAQHFTFEEFTATNHATLQDENRQQALVFVDALTVTAQLAEQVRALFGAPIIIHDAYRCKALNDAVGSQDHSQHMVGQAFDFHVAGLEAQLRPCLDKIVASGIQFHQLLIEGACLHLGTYRPYMPNGEVAWWSEGDKIIYRPYV